MDVSGENVRRGEEVGFYLMTCRFYIRKYKWWNTLWKYLPK